GHGEQKEEHEQRDAISPSERAFHVEENDAEQARYGAQEIRHYGRMLLQHRGESGHMNAVSREEADEPSVRDDVENIKDVHLVAHRNIDEQVVDHEHEKQSEKCAVHEVARLVGFEESLGIACV